MVGLILIVCCPPQINLADNRLCGIDEYGFGEYTADGIKAIADAIGVSASLTEIILRDNKLGKEGWCTIFDALRENPQNKIAKWDLSSQGIRGEIAKSLAAYMAVSASLTECCVRGNKLDRESAKMLADVATEKRIMLFGIQHDQKEADFSNKGLMPADAILVANDLSVSASLTVTDLRYNQLDTESATMLATIAKEKQISLCGITPDQTGQT